MKPDYLFISPTGGIQAVASERAEAIARSIGSTCKRRASHVVPANWFKRQAFRLLRWLADDDSTESNIIEQWCRSWPGPWQVRFAETPHRVEFQHPSRHVCIDFEVKTLNRKFAGN